ncbi:hypothetical protein ACR0ST_08905 [Aliidiomarina sp. Khilg15.8]
MRAIYTIILFLALSPIANAQMGGFNSLSEPRQKILERIVHYLGIEDSSNDVKMKVYDRIDYLFTSEQWNSYLNHLNELSASNYKENLGKGYVTFSFNTSDSGLHFLTFLYKPEAKQIFLETKQVRYGKRDVALEVYNKTKADEDFVAVHDTDTHALLKEDGYLAYQYYNVDSDHGTVVYRRFTVIDI